MTVLHHAGVYVRDMEQSLRFYRDGLGLTVLVDKVLPGDMEPLLGVHTAASRTVFLGDPDRRDAGIVELLDLGIGEIGDGAAQSGLPSRGVFLLAVQVDVEQTLRRLEELGLGGTPRIMPLPNGNRAATVVDPDGVVVELLALGPLSIMDG
ncbi:MAG TPA: VOC family protein [Mycobacterium sp.]|nr:VOC family protein [Mycobacterium sp.]